MTQMKGQKNAEHQLAYKNKQIDKETLNNQQLKKD